MTTQTLHFREDGSFKILQLTDVHYGGEYPVDKKTTELIKKLIDLEQPDLITLTGDVSTCEENIRFLPDALQPVTASGIPWMFQFGNHDTEYGEGYEKFFKAVCALPGSMTANDESSGFGWSNQHVEIQTKDNQTRWSIFGIDSNAYFADKVVGGYDYIHRSQVDWYQREIKKLEQECGDFGALAFMHIALPEYNDVWNYHECYGVKLEGVCSPIINSGMFAAMHEAGHTRGVFVGHDHINDYIGDYYGIKLGYGRATGYNTYSKDGFLKGGRTIIINENDTHDFITYITLEDGTKPPQQRHMPECKRED